MEKFSIQGKPIHVARLVQQAWALCWLGLLCTCKVPLASWHSRLCKGPFNGNVHLWTRSSAPQQGHTIIAQTPLRLLLRYLTSHSSTLLGNNGGKKLVCYCSYTDGRLWRFSMWSSSWFLKEITVEFELRLQTG